MIHNSIGYRNRVLCIFIATPFLFYLPFQSHTFTFQLTLTYRKMLLAKRYITHKCRTKNGDNEHQMYIFLQNFCKLLKVINEKVTQKALRMNKANRFLRQSNEKKKKKREISDQNSNTPSGRESFKLYF